MNFFWKSHNNSNEEVTTATSQQDSVSTPSKSESSTNAPSSTTTSDSSSSMMHTAIPTNDPAFQIMVREEAKRLRMREQILTAPHLARVQDALRLNETKMENIEENLNRTRTQQDRVHRYSELSFELHEQKAHLYEVNKQMASSINEREALDRFEEFENVQGRFQRLTVLETFRREQKLRMTELSHTIDEAAKELEDDKKRLQQKVDELRDATRKFEMGLESVNEAQQIDGRMAYISIYEGKLSSRINSLSSMQLALEKEMEEYRRSMEKVNAEMTALRTRRQSLAPHHRMAVHGELILERLGRFNELEEELDKSERQLKESLRKQSDENDMLGRVYTEYQQIVQDIQGLQDELVVHRENNHGLESYRLQERAMKLKLRRAMLLSAQSLWTRIANGYNMIEDLMQRINSLRLKQETLVSALNNLSKEVSVLRHTVHDKEYTFTLSKSQNVIQLRSDLKEGSSCTVCGATHHPYHSDTMLEQNKLIGELKMEYEALAGELRSKEQQLREMELDGSNIAATKEEAENTLITLRALQNSYVSDWQMYRDLDSTFASCDSSVNAEARTAMLRQLTENIGKEVDVAQKELDTFNFHQQRINVLTEQIAVKEQKKNELITRLNEVNTGCQVMAGHLERLQTHKQVIRDSYSHLFETLNKMITVPDWRNTWNRSHEALIMQIQELTKECLELEEKLNEAEHKRALQDSHLTHLQNGYQNLLAQIGLLSDDKQECHELLVEDKQKLEKLIGKESSKKMLQQILSDMQETRQKMEEQREKTHQKALKCKEAEGRLTENNEVSAITDERSQAERQGVDLWMRKYNANHPPVQYNELEEMFATDRNWNDIRLQIRELQLDALLTQARVDKIGSQLVALQAEVNIGGSDTDIMQNQLAGQIETLEGRRRETMMQIAMLTLQLTTHEKAESAIKEEKMKEKC